MTVHTDTLATNENSNTAHTIVLAGGCFWGLEELLRSHDGLLATEVGYTGGDNDNPTYEYHPGHAEAVHVTFENDTLSLSELLAFYFSIHDPTTLNRQGNDIGTSYRSEIFYTDASQLADINDALSNAKKFWTSPLTTKVSPLRRFWRAEEYHQKYLEKHPGGYTCHFIR